MSLLGVIASSYKQSKASVFALKGAYGQVGYSSDGISWNLKNDSTAPLITSTFITRANNKFVTLAQDDSGVYYFGKSDDGITWTYTATNIVESDEVASCVVYGNGVYVCCGFSSLYGGSFSGQDIFTNGNWYYSSDGTIWTQGTTDVYMEYVGFGGGIFVTLDLNGNVLTSSDGINWTTIEAVNAYNMSSYVYHNGLHVIGCDDNSGGMGYVVIGNGTNWYRHTIDSSYQFAPGKIVYGNNVFLAVGYPDSGYNSTNICAVSSNGVNWTVGYLPYSDEWGSATFGNGIFMVMHALQPNFLSPSSYYATSTDGLTWTGYNPPYDPNSGASGDKYYVTFG